MNSIMYMNALAFPLPAWLIGLVNFFAADDASDKTEENEDKIVDDLDNAFGEGDDEEEDGKDDDGKKDEKKDDKKDEKKDEKSKADSSAIHQKKKYREELKKANDKIKELEGKKNDTGALSDEEKREKAAAEFLAKKIEEVISSRETARTEQQKRDEEQFQDELDAVLEENTDITEEQLIEICEELEVSPQQALKAIRREMKARGKTKPKMPDNKRGTGEVEKDDAKPKKTSTFDDVNRIIKEGLKKGIF